MLPGEDKNSEVAMIEFETKDEALVAQTRDQKMIDDNTINVQLGSGSTLFVTNFPPEADEKYIRDLFRDVSHPFFYSLFLSKKQYRLLAVTNRVTKAWRNCRHSLPISQVQYSSPLLLCAI